MSNEDKTLINRFFTEITDLFTSDTYLEPGYIVYNDKNKEVYTKVGSTSNKNSKYSKYKSSLKRWFKF